VALIYTGGAGTEAGAVIEHRFDHMGLNADPSDSGRAASP